MELVWLFLGCVFVFSQAISTIVAYRLNKRTCKMIDLQIGALKSL